VEVVVRRYFGRHEFGGEQCAVVVLLVPVADEFSGASVNGMRPV
jgi:hypothetical protein